MVFAARGICKKPDDERVEGYERECRPAGILYPERSRAASRKEMELTARRIYYSMKEAGRHRKQQPSNNRPAGIL